MVHDRMADLVCDLFGIGEDVFFVLLHRDHGSGLEGDVFADPGQIKIHFIDSFNDAAAPVAEGFKTGRDKFRVVVQAEDKVLIPHAVIDIADSQADTDHRRIIPFLF